VDVPQALAEVFERDGAVVEPSPPVALRIARLVRNRDWAIPEMARLAAADPAIAVELLCAPAARRGGARSASIPRALDLVGVRGLAKIASDVARGAEGVAAGPFSALRRAAWRDALSAAVLCRELARMRGLPEDDAYACGLLHDLGRIAGLSLVERLAAGARACDVDALGWPPIVSRWHARLGAELAERRGLPATVVDAMALHHSDAPEPARSPALVRVVRTIDAALRVFGADEPRPEDLVALGDLAWWEAERIGDTRQGVAAMIDALDSQEVPSAGAARRTASRSGTVVLRIAGREHAATSVSLHGLMIVGPVPLGEGALVEVERFEPTGPAFHARVALSWTEGDRYRAILVPVALRDPPGVPPRPAAA
jgi:putative nucleotidyltransferase with HDIG domain